MIYLDDGCVIIAKVFMLIFYNSQSSICHPIYIM